MGNSNLSWIDLKGYEIVEKKKEEAEENEYEPASIEGEEEEARGMIFMER